MAKKMRSRKVNKSKRSKSRSIKRSKRRSMKKPKNSLKGGSGWLWSYPEVTIIGRDSENKIINEGTGKIVGKVKNKDYHVVELDKPGKGEKIQQSIPSYKLIKGDFEAYKKKKEGEEAARESWVYNKFTNI